MKWMLAAPLAAVALAGCGGSSSTSASSSATASAAAVPVPRISTGRIAGLGTVLVNGRGHTLYVFEPDQHRAVTCLSGCAAVWPPLFAASSKPVVTAPVRASVLGSDVNPAGGRVVTYDGWPLYRYAGDGGPGTASGQAEDLNGGLWYVITPSGLVVTKNPAG